jgi:hypothetical protein
MRSVFQEQPDVAHVFLGSKRHMMERIFNDENEPFWRSAKQIELGVIAPERFTPFAIERFAGTGKQLSEPACAEIMQLTGGHPYATQELLYALWEETGRGESAQAAHVARAVEQTLRSENAHFSLLWERASATQRMLLAALAREQPARPLSAPYQQRHSLPSTPAVQAALESLIRSELAVRQARGEYRIAEPFLAEWIERNEA